MSAPVVVDHRSQRRDRSSHGRGLRRPRRQGRPARPGRARSRGGRGRRQAGRRHALVLPVDVADADQVEDGGRAGAEAELGRDRRVGQRRVHLGVLPVRPDRAGGVQAGHRGQLPRLRLRHHGGAEADEAARPRRDRAGRVGAGVPGHPAADRLLRGQARDPGLHRVAALRAAAREEQRARDDGADAGGEHAAVLLGAVPAAAAPEAGAADLPAGGRGRRAVLYAADHPQRREYWVAARRRRHADRQRGRAGLLDRYLARTGFDAQQTDAAARPGRAGQPLGAGRPATRTSARTASSTTAHPRSTQLWASQHHGAVAAGLAAAAGLGLALWRQR